jgi:hypothetical protein
MLYCSLFNQVCQLFSTNIASVFILVKFNTVYDSFSRWKAFACPTFFTAVHGRREAMGGGGVVMV